MSKPTEFTRWATDGGADVVEPGSGTKDSGYIDAAVPDAGELNWILNRIYLWEVWLNAFESTVHTWTADQLFNANVGVRDNFTHGSGSTGKTAYFLGVGNDFFCEQDAAFTNTVAFGALVSFDTLEVATAATFNGPANFPGTIIDPVEFTDPVTFDGVVTADAGINSNGSSTFTATTTFNLPIVYGGSAPTSSTSKTNTIEGANTARMLATVLLNNTTSNRVQEGYNVLSVVQNLGTGFVSVTFAAAMATANYQIFFNFEIDPTVDARFKITLKTTVGFVFVFEDRAGPSNILGAGSSGYAFNLAVFGQQ